MLNARCALKSGAGLTWDHFKRSGTAIPKGVAHAVLRESGDAAERKRKQARRKWIRYERRHSNWFCPSASLGVSVFGQGRETPAMAFERKAPPPGSDITDE